MSEQLSLPTWLYIAGRGHSGSTMLDGMLGNASNIESVGELVSGMGKYEALCSCGETFRDCPFWIEARKRFENESDLSWDNAVHASVEQAHIKRFLRTLLSSPDIDWVRALKELSDHMLVAISQVNSTGGKIVVDSSKEITRALFFTRFVPQSRVIHLVRHPYNILQSNYYRLKKGNGIKFLRIRFKPKRWYGPFLFVSVLSWLIGNFLLEMVNWFCGKPFLRVRYEDLIKAPIEELNRIEKFIGVSLDGVKKKIIKKGIFDIGHNIGGNQMRMSGSFVFDPHKAMRDGLPKPYRLMVNLVCWPLLAVYKYD